MSFGRLAGEPCHGANTVVLVDGLAGRLEVPDVFCAIVFELGPPTPWFGTEFGPRRSDDGPDADAVIAALDPFGEAE